jgi:hypothetical protein
VINTNSYIITNKKKKQAKKKKDDDPGGTRRAVAPGSPTLDAGGGGICGYRSGMAAAHKRSSAPQ